MRPIDGDVLKHNLENAKENAEQAGKQIYSEIFNTFIGWVERMPTLTQPNGWISVADRLPEERADVLMWRNRWKIQEAGVYRKSSFWVYDEIGDSYIADDITYWMPLPAPPKERQS